MSHSDIQRVFKHVPGPFLILKPDEHFTIAAASDECLRATRTTPAICGRPLREVFPGADPGPSLQRVVLTDDGQVEYIIHRVEDAAGSTQRDAIDILESITEGFFTLDRQWRFDYMNREAHRILGREPGDLTGKVLWTEYPGLEGTAFESSYHKTMYQRETSSFTAFYPGHERWYEVTTFPAPEGVSVYFRDVTEAKKMQAERERLVAESERQRRIYETALNSTPDFVYVFDLQHRALYANEALTKVWGVDDVRGKTWMDLGYEQWHADMHDRELDRVITTRAPIRGEIPFTGTNGTRMYDYIFAPVLGPDGEVVAVAGTTRDITERQAAEQAVREQAGRLAESDRAKDEFLATLSHELRNPLAPLRNALELMRRTGPRGDSSDFVLSMMERQVNHLVRLVDDLLEVSRISRGKFSLRKERVELSAIVHNAVETSEPLIRAGGHSLAIALPDEPAFLEGDPVRLAQILANLLNNAAKYTDDGGDIGVHASIDGENAVIAVRDNGIGIQPEALPRMFEMFSRGDRDSGRSQGGLGIGLALSLRLAQMHGGTIEANSAGVGEGSEFTVRLPLAAAVQASEPTPAPEAASLAKTRVLVVDDNHDAGDSLGQVLGILGADVRVARDGAEALDAFASYQPSVVLLDIGMPGMNGYEVARTIRTRFPHRPASLVALTGWGQDDDRRRAREAGFDHHLVKPAEISALQKLLGSLQ